MPIVENTEPVSGHGVIVSITLDPVGAPETFTELGYITSALNFETSRSMTKSTPHDRDINYVVLGPEEHPDMTFTVDYVASEDTHQYLWTAKRTKAFVGLLWEFDTGLGSDGGVLRSGYISNVKFLHDAGAGIRRNEVTFVPSGPYWVDGELIGA